MNFRLRNESIYHVKNKHEKLYIFSSIKKIMLKIVHDNYNHVKHYRVYAKFVKIIYIYKLFKNFITYIK